MRRRCVGGTRTCFSSPSRFLKAASVLLGRCGGHQRWFLQNTDNIQNAGNPLNRLLFSYHVPRRAVQCRSDYRSSRCLATADYMQAVNRYYRIYHLQAGNRYYYLQHTSGQPLLPYSSPTSGHPLLLISTTYKRAAVTTIYHLQAGNRYYYYLPPTSGQPLLLSTTYKRITATTTTTTTTTIITNTATIYHLQAGNR